VYKDKSDIKNGTTLLDVRSGINTDSRSDLTTENKPVQLDILWQQPLLHHRHILIITRPTIL